MHPSVKKTATGVATIAALGLGGAALADAASQSSTTPPSSSAPPSGAAPSGTTPPSSTTPGTPGRPGHRGGGRGLRGTALTGATADKVKAAALAKVPGATVLRLSTDPRATGAYLALVRKTDDTPVIVRIDKDFKVTGTTALRGGPRGFRGGPGGEHRGGSRGDCPKDGAAAKKDSGTGSGSDGTAPASYDTLT